MNSHYLYFQTANTMLLQAPVAKTASHDGPYPETVSQNQACFLCIAFIGYFVSVRQVTNTDKPTEVELMNHIIILFFNF